MATKRIIEAGGLFPDGVLIAQTGEKLGFLGATPVVQPANAAQAAITDSSGGTADGTVAAVADIALSTSNTYTDAAVNSAVNAAIATINDNMAELVVLQNRLRADLVTLGLIKGSA